MSVTPNQLDSSVVQPALKSNWIEIGTPELVFASIVLLVVVVAGATSHRIIKLVLENAEHVPGKRELVWVSLVSTAVVSTMAIIVVAGMMNVLSSDSIGTLLTILVTAVGVKLFDSSSVGSKSPDEKQSSIKTKAK